MTRKHTTPPIYAGAYLFGLLMTYMAVGWVLAAYAAPLLMWVWAFLLIAYVAWAGTGAIAVAMLWVVSVVWIAAYTSATPLLMNWKGPTWAISLVGVWIFAIGAVLMLAFAQMAIRTLGWPRPGIFYRLLMITGAGMLMGRLLYWGSMPTPQSMPILDLT
ncbi:hypothetical protein [Acaryochloris sp. IP29b_bin.137]|uniref:hypothetical protein n=1 Tax=Acaryochloris sp. IP29b_bin.137 TaxID=2969217 RepID=UPI00262B21D0|nr:hypothetical protein [Acaryochloris sp. IP29b_bin.137]